MFFSDCFFLLIFFVMFFCNFFLPINSNLHLLLIAELMWIILFLISLFLGFTLNSLSLISLTFFILIFSAVEFSLGLILLMFFNFFFRTINIFFFDQIITKTSTKWYKRFLQFNYLN